MALSDFERVVVRVLGVAGFACSFLSGDSDVFVMKKTPFYSNIRHLINGVGNLFTATKKDCRLPLKGEVTGPRWCSTRHVFVCALRRRGYVN